MRTYRKEIEGKTICAYNDSGCDWVVYCIGGSTQRFPQKVFSMRDAMWLYAKGQAGL